MSVVTIENKGALYRSKPYTWTTGESATIETTFLERAMSRMQAPVVRELVFHWSGTISGVTATLFAKDACQLISEIKIRDRGGVIYQLPSKLVRLENQIELGSRQYESEAVASGATDTTYNVIMRVTFDLEQATRGADTAVPLLHLLQSNGGEISLSFGTPVGSVSPSGTVRMYAIVHDERERKLKSRRVVKDFAISLAEDSYPVNGSLRKAWICSNPSTTGMTSLSGITSVTCEELGLQDMNPLILQQEYIRCRSGFSSLDETNANYAIPIIWPSRGQKIGKMPDLKGLLLKLNTTITSGRLLVDYIEDRNVGLAAEWLGYKDAVEFALDVEEHGEVDIVGASNAKATLWGDLARRLPMRIRK